MATLGSTRRRRRIGIPILGALLLLALPLAGVSHAHPAPGTATVSAAKDAVPSAASCPLCRLAHEHAIAASTILEASALQLSGAPPSGATSRGERCSSLRLASRAPPSIT